MTRIIWILAGILALVLASLGAVLPVLPTTPFVIFAAFAFGKSSVRLRTWLVNNKIFGSMIAQWEATGAIDRKYKNMAFLLMGLAFLASVLMGIKLIILCLQALCMVAAGFYIATRPEPERALKQNHESKT